MQVPPRFRLLASEHDRRIAALGAALKAAIGAAFCALLILIGVSTAGPDHETLTVPRLAAAPTSEHDAAAHRRQVFEQRRARFLAAKAKRDAEKMHVGADGR